MTSSPVTRVSLFFLEPFSQAFLKKYPGDLCFGIVKSLAIVIVEQRNKESKWRGMCGIVDKKEIRNSMLVKLGRRNSGYK